MFVRGRPAAAPAAAWAAAPSVPPGRSDRRHVGPGPAIVYVAGHVRHPGVYRVSAEARVADALARAGGAAGDADLVAVNLAARVVDGEEIAVPAQGERAAKRAAASRPARAPRTRSPRAAPRAAAVSPPDAFVDINRADEAELATLPGLGPALAHRIVAFREQYGPFNSAEELLDVSGVTDARLARFAEYVKVR